MSDPREILSEDEWNAAFAKMKESSARRRMRLTTL
jgi:hypothetical protein